MSTEGHPLITKTSLIEDDMTEEPWEADLEGVAWCLGRRDELDELAARIKAILASPR